MFCQKLNLFGCLPIWQSINMTVARFNYFPHLLNPSFLKIMYIAILENLILHLARFFFSSWMLVENQCQKNALVSYLRMHCIKKSPYSRLFCPNVEKCGKNADQNNSEYEHFLRSDGIYVYSIQKVFFDWKKVLFGSLNFIFFSSEDGLFGTEV